jgi:hypothetical protein
LNAWSAELSYTMVMSGGKQSVVYKMPIVWRPSTLTTTLDPHLGREEISFSELWAVSRPYLLLMAGWGVGVATGALGLVWMLR